eukprot:6183558-Pleurochrysis_carterae.AAC.5
MRGHEACPGEEHSGVQRVRRRECYEHVAGRSEAAVGGGRGSSYRGGLRIVRSVVGLTNLK